VVRDLHVSGLFRRGWLLTPATLGLDDLEGVSGDSTQRLWSVEVPSCRCVSRRVGLERPRSMAA
jgi:hypothetical protein